MDDKTELQKVSEETMRFMRGKYKLDEVPGKYYDIDCLKFRQGRRTILSINIHEDHYDFQIIYGKAEREKFEARLGEFPQAIQDLYKDSRALPDGLWMLIRVEDLETLEAVKQMIMIKKKPNRKPFPKEQAVYSKCGHRCDLCVHYCGGTVSDEFRIELRERVERVYGGNFDDDGCPGCVGKTEIEGNVCEQLKCAAEKGTDKCLNCKEYPCATAPVGLCGKIEAKGMLADDVTWAILPFVHEQYGN